MSNPSFGTHPDHPATTPAARVAVVRAQAIANGTTTTSSAPKLTATTVAGLVSLSAPDLADPSLVIGLTLEGSVRVGAQGWSALGPRVDWTGGLHAAPPTITASAADRVRLVLDPNRPVSIGASLSFT